MPQSNCRSGGKATLRWPASGSATPPTDLYFIFRNLPMREAVFVSTARTPLTKAHRGEFNITPGPTLASFAIRAAVDRARIDPGLIEDVVLGCGNPEGRMARNIGRQTAIRAGLPVGVAGTTV